MLNTKINQTVIYPIQKCNYNCRYCSMQKWMPKDDHVDWTIWRDYIKKWFDPKDWVIKITGGEPTLYDGFEELLASLTDYRVIIETNGSNQITKRHNQIIYAMWHENRPKPVCYDILGILEETEGWEEKVAATEGEKRLITPLRAGFGTKDGHLIDFEIPGGGMEGKFCFIYSDGTSQYCPIIDARKNILEGTEPPDGDCAGLTCGHKALLRYLRNNNWLWDVSAAISESWKKCKRYVYPE